MKNKIFIFLLILVILVSAGLTEGVLALLQAHVSGIQTQAVAVQSVGNTITATGTVHSQEEASLHFQTPGKLVYLPFKEGDSVTTGQTIAQLDTYPLQQQLTQALNTYRSTRDNFDQTQQNVNNGVLPDTQKTTVKTTSGDTASSDYINDIVKRIVDQNQANLDNSVISVQLANYALQMATLTAPFNGIITQEDVTTPGQNITAATTFSIADPTQLVFRANVDASEIDYISLNAKATIQLPSTTFNGTVIKIYPQKTTLPTGEDVYQVDIAATNLSQQGRLGQNGNVIIQSTIQQEATIVPTWTIVGHNYIWVLRDNKPVLQKVTVGDSRGNKTDVSGLPENVQIIVNPKNIVANNYSLL